MREGLPTLLRDPGELFALLVGEGRQKYEAPNSDHETTP